jgi:hypothetical protein
MFCIFHFKKHVGEFKMLLNTYVLHIILMDLLFFHNFHPIPCG